MHLVHVAVEDKPFELSHIHTAIINFIKDNGIKIGKVNSTTKQHG